MIVGRPHPLSRLRQKDTADYFSAAKHVIVFDVRPGRHALEAKAVFVHVSARRHASVIHRPSPAATTSRMPPSPARASTRSHAPPCPAHTSLGEPRLRTLALETRHHPCAE